MYIIYAFAYMLWFLMCFYGVCVMLFCMFKVLLYFTVILFCFLVLPRWFLKRKRAWHWMGGKVGRSGRRLKKGNRDQNILYGGKRYKVSAPLQKGEVGR